MMPLCELTWPALCLNLPITPCELLLLLYVVHASEFCAWELYGLSYYSQKGTGIAQIRDIDPEIMADKFNSYFTRLAKWRSDKIPNTTFV